jgi:hypothetical protein
MGVGLGAGVGGEAGADGSKLCGMFEEVGLRGICMGRGWRVEDMGAFRLLSEEGAANTGGGAGRRISFMSASSMGVALRAKFGFI